ncbi:type IV toxin-antitoxin system AbiEi family antitoxin domain-containing protein [Actinomadura alba]|uniref:Type IV toxin-antitoxin system AbiEi family antitoxin domain-containing protein n=1 Tax=Actinomadura alba TaxID=406431 RepID=A0ABR7LNL7_9ACTN|nr:type IV toxin-antitoxin system AbiEi family antitoxin domain-containing protein [Actinomadura alba]MBC6466003.1 type IV toxin-antitoxin system AbiEi family antitoxin domain-containing protein [Actinomadura alba]
MDGLTFREAAARGISKGLLSRRVRDGILVPITRGAYLRPDQIGSLEARASVISRLLPPHTVVARRTAAWLWGLDVLPPGVDAARWPVELVVPPDHTPPRRPGIEVRLSQLPPDEITEVSGVRVTSMERTAMDCGRWLPRLEAVAAVDQFLRWNVDPGRLGEMAARLAGERNARLLRRVLAAADRGAESPGESWSRVRIIDAGLPRPGTQIPVMGRHGNPLFVDLGYEDYRVGVEYDGEPYHSTPAARAHDEDRRRWLEARHGWVIIPITSVDVLVRPRPFLTALVTALLDRGWRPDDEQMIEIGTNLSRLSGPRAA